MMKSLLWAAGLMFFGTQFVTHADTKRGIPTDDAKDPSTLNKMLTPSPTPSIVTLATDETSYQDETNYQTLAAAPTPTPVAAPIKSGTFDKTVGEVRLRGYQARPAKDRPLAALLLVPDWWGLNGPIKAQADLLAGQGYKVLAIDLYGQPANSRQQAARLMREVKPEKALARLKLAVELLGKADDGDKPLKVAVVGWAFGATYALRLTVVEPNLAAAVLFYGEPLRDPAALAKIHCPLLAFYAERDLWVTPRKVGDFQQALGQAKVRFEGHTYDTQPGFYLSPRDANEQSYGNVAWQTMLTFFKQNLL